jgi:putative tryptophan/tyrosine transport system substrate-binding protein
VNRRDFMYVLGGAAAWPRVAHAQPAMPVVGFIRTTSPEDSAPFAAAFRQGLSEAGYVDGRNVRIEYRYARDRFETLPGLAAELANQPVAVLVATGGTVSGLAAKAATSTIPVVFTTNEDPVKVGLVASLSRPGGNMTGISMIGAMLGPKRLDLVRQLVPTASKIALLVYPNNPDTLQEAEDILAAARTIGVEIFAVDVRAESDFDAAFETAAQKGAVALMVAGSTFFNSRRNQLITLAARHAMPTIYALRGFAVDGGLISYGPDIASVYRLAGVYAGRILKGARPADLPVELSAKFELVINLKTAKTLGLTIPPTLLARADEVIE